MNSRFSLAVHVLTLLASNPEERLTSEFLARSIGTNAVVIRTMLASLRRAGLVTSKSAGGGGWRLAKPAVEITLDRIRQAAMEGETGKMHRNSPHPDCAVGRDVRRVLGTVYAQGYQAMDRELAELSVEGILSEVRKREKVAVWGELEGLGRLVETGGQQSASNR
jgi:DNA-binding IscR family transcriptional regulator